MIVWNPVDSFVSKLASCRQRYRCLVDGQDEYRGESLPSGTQAEVLAWIKARYKVLGQLFAVDMDYPRRNTIFELGPSLGFDVETWVPVPVAKRYLVEVEGMEWMFVLRPVPDGLLDWKPGRVPA